MARDSLSQRKAQLDKAEREHLEDVVTEMRERVEDNVAFQLTQRGLDEEPEDSPDEDIQKLVEAIELEAVDGDSWAEAVDQYVTGVGYTIVNRLAALRCMEVRGFVDEEVTVFKENGLTPAAETLVHGEFLLEDEAIIQAYHDACDDLADEIEILFDRSSAYSLVDPDDDTYEDLCGLLDSVPDEVWRADDVLGWVYEYYNVKLLDDLRRKGDREGLEPEDVPPANQFYTPHWVVRMLTDNSLGKLYLESAGELSDVVESQAALSPEERKDRPLSPDESPDIADFCTYLVPSEEAGEPTDFDHPRELRVIDPACGSGHFLLYAFDVLERIWRAETDVPDAEIPRKVLQHNLYGVDLDMRACQLAAFNLYLKGRTRAEAEGAAGFAMPEVGIVCADASVADVEGVEAVFEEVAGDDADVQRALNRILDAFEEVHGLGSLLDVRGTLGDLFEDDADGGLQLTLGDDPRKSHTLGQVLHSLRDAVAEHREGGSFLAQDLRSFVRLLDILAQEYDVALMNPPYGSRNRMPTVVKEYVEKRYEYSPEFYINFFEVCDALTEQSGRVGMLVPRSFMFKRSFEDFRTDFVGGQGSFDFLAEFGLGVLDNATVRTVGTVVRTDTAGDRVGNFIRLYDAETKQKEAEFLAGVFGTEYGGVKRLFQVSLSEFQAVPKSPMNFAIPSEVRALHASPKKIDADAASIEGESVAKLAQGLATGDNPRFIRKYWETLGIDYFKPISKGGSEAWIRPKISHTVNYRANGREMRPMVGSRIQNERYYGRRGLTWTYIKETGRRFGALGDGYWFDQTGSMLFPNGDDLWTMVGVLNSKLYHALFLSLTPGRHWTPGVVGRIPWREGLSELDSIGERGRSQHAALLRWRATDPTSLYYVGPALLPTEYDSGLFYGEPDTGDVEETKAVDRIGSDAGDSITRAAEKVDAARAEYQSELESEAADIDQRLYSHLDISAEAQAELETEIELRTGGGETGTDGVDTQALVRALVHHFAMEAVRAEPDGVVPLHATDGQADMLGRIVARFEDAYGEHAEDRLVEVDEILGAESAADEAYPNLRAFVADDLFDDHVSRMENTPIVWKLTTERLVSDPAGEGFACFLDYHALDSGLFDRLANRYLEPRKAELRERRSAANRRRSDESLSASEQAAAAEEYERCASGLDQIAVFEDVIQDLGSVDERDVGAETRALASELAPKVAAFREATRERVETLAELHERKGEAWFRDAFSDTFWRTVDEERAEWLDALAELEGACEAYAKPADEPVAAHLADLFDYFHRRLKGSDHYSSTGILFMTYYFEREGSDLLDATGQPHDHLSEDERLLASLATGLDESGVVDEAYLQELVAEEDVEGVEALPPLAEFKALAEEIDDRCTTLDERIPDDWADRALAEITTAGYQPNRKHGVEINVTPLADAEIVPKTVEEDVL
ncbi:BREX-5 system adenine-specific DNA-methyltransferase PglX [Haloplanus sp. C73]|uniref:BREX-5 system adenine-specific DNA-methyltransferase PglX n=1 Tax=Haloplanus sp. C73 TaxID=3421641 RepID=UPI003EC0CD36